MIDAGRVQLPSKSDWSDLMGKFVEDPKAIDPPDFINALQEQLLDDRGLIRERPDPDNKNVQIVPGNPETSVYVEGKKFLEMEFLDAVMCSILLHRIFDIKWPANLRNLSIFLRRFFSLEEVCDILPGRAEDNLEEFGVSRKI